MTEYRITSRAKTVSGYDVPEGTERVILPKTARSIEEFSFFAMNGIKELVLPEGFESIGMSAFDGSTIERLVFPSSLKEIGNGAFRGCRQLKSVVFLGEGPEIIESVAFQDCTALESVQFGTGLKITGSETLFDYGGAFEDCSSLKEAILPEGMVHIGNATFRNCTSLARITLPSTLKAIGEEAFTAAAIRELIVPEGVEHCFNVAPLCPNIERIVIPSTVQGLSLKAFGGKAALKEVVLPKKFQEDFDLFFPSDARERMKIVWT